MLSPRFPSVYFMNMPISFIISRDGQCWFLNRYRYKFYLIRCSKLSFVLVCSQAWLLALFEVETGILRFISDNF